MLEVVPVTLGLSDFVRDPLGLWIRRAQAIQGKVHYSITSTQRRVCSTISASSRRLRQAIRREILQTKGLACREILFECGGGFGFPLSVVEK